MIAFQKIPASKSSLTKRKIILGVGVNDADYVTGRKVDGKSVRCPVYSKWINMIRRCYCPKYHEKHPSYVDCAVAYEWLRFSNFASWFNENNIEGYELDKDIKVKGNKFYSPETCLFVPRCINALFVDHAAKRGDYPIGVSYDKRRDKFQARVTIDGAGKSVGYYSTTELAHKAYVSAKNSEILRKSKQYPEFSVYLINHMK